MRTITKGATSQKVYFQITNSSTGDPLTGLVYNSSGLIASYIRNGAARVAIALVTLASPSAAFSSGGFVEVDATNAPGLYRLDGPDAAFATGVDSVTLVLVGGASNVYPVQAEVQLTTMDLQSADFSATQKASITTAANASLTAFGAIP